jgi:hypothetical protein
MARFIYDVLQVVSNYQFSIAKPIRFAGASRNNFFLTVADF